MSQIVANRIRTPDGTLLQSYHVHDYKTHIDANGKEYMVDGGLAYQRYNVHEDAPHTDESVWTDDSHEEQRQAFHWGTYGKNGDQPKTWVPLSYLTNAHIEAIMETQRHIPDWLFDLFQDELDFRAEHKIYLEDI